MKIQAIYKFKGVDHLYADTKGNFFFKNKPARKVYNNGSISVMCGKTKRGIIKLRTLAYKTTLIVNDTLPF